MVERIITPLGFSRASGTDCIWMLAELSSCEPELSFTLFDFIHFDSFKDQIARAFDVLDIDCVIALDISKAFDKISHLGLLQSHFHCIFLIYQ